VKIQILPSAIADLAAGFAFYEQQQPGLGDRFLDSLIADIDSIKVSAGVDRRIFAAHRRLAHIFPFAIYYVVEGEMIRVKAVLDCRRDPSWIRSKLK